MRVGNKTIPAGMLQPARHEIMRDMQGKGTGGFTAALGGAVLGPALQLQQADLWTLWAYAGLAAIGATALYIAIKLVASRWRAPLVLVAAAVFAFAATGLRASVYAAQGLDAHLEGRDIEVTGVVASMPQRTDSGIRFRLAVESAREGGTDVRLPAQLQLGWYHGVVPGPDAMELQRRDGDLRPGERWRMTVRLKAPHGQLNPGGFDFELWLWEHGVQATGYVRAGLKDPPPRRLAATWHHPIEQLRHSVRDAIYERVADRRLAGVLAALVAGDQGAIERADWDVFRATGVAHLMSISGLHVTMFAWAAAALVGWLWRRSARLCLTLPAQQAALIGGVLLATGYAAFSGWGVPAQRTVWMLASVALLRLGGRHWPWPSVWLLACAVVVALDPWALTQPGFWLSFVAVGVLFASDAGHRQRPAPAEGGGVARGALRRAGHAVRGLVREQWVVTAALTPLSLLLFGQVSLVGLAANLVAIPWVTLVITPLALAGIALPPLWDAAAWAVQGLAWLLQVLATFPLATVTVASAPLVLAAAAVLGGALLVMPLPPSLRLLGLPLLLPVLLWQAPRPAAGEFELLAADVGQGNAVIVRTATRTLVYDAGPRYSPESDAGHRVLVPLLRHTGERVDMLMLSHRDSDHTGGAAALLAMQPQARLLGSLEAGHELQALRAQQRCEAGQAWRWDGVAFEVLHPPAEAYETATRPNALSCVLRVSNGQAAALLAGDIEQAQEARLVASTPVRADLVLVPHHGSKTSSSEALLDAVRPAVALVQAGYRNRFGHPAPVVVERYRVRGIALVESARCGAARWLSAAPRAVECQRENARRYWHHVQLPSAAGH